MINKTRRTKLLLALGLLAFLILLAVFFCSGGNLALLQSLFSKKRTGDEIREILYGLGLRGYITITLLSMMQVVFAFLPAEPVQVLAGLTFGFSLGFICSMIGIFLGSTFVFLLYRIFGDRVRAYFVKNLDFDFENAQRSKRIALIVFALYFLPAIPYGMICFFACGFGIKYPRYIFLTLLGAIPSVCIGVGLGHMTLATSWVVSLTVFIVLLVLIILAMVCRKRLFAAINARIAKEPYSSKTTVRAYSSAILAFLYVMSRIVFFLRGVRVRYHNRVEGEIKTPSIVLCNHGSFIDFAYAGSLIRKKSPNFIVARLYFYKKWLGNLLRRIGCFPKSMFAVDLESAKNCLRVLRNGGVLAMMPEARLSTVGRFEDIQPGTYSFLKKAGVPIYTIKIEGDYLADPKWGNGVRRGARVEASLELLLTAEEVAVLSAEEIGARVETRLSYDELAWIKTKPEIRYRSRTMAEGLENILIRCPKCNQKYTLTTKKRDVFCAHCGRLTSLDCRYAFTGGVPFAHFAAWYDWQKELLQAEIEQDPSYCLQSEVEFYLPSTDGKKLLRYAGTGICTLDRSGLRYEGEKDAEPCSLLFPLEQIYRLLFGAGENFEIYVGSEIHYFVPKEKRSAVEWYLASMILVDRITKDQTQGQ